MKAINAVPASLSSACCVLWADAELSVAVSIPFELFSAVLLRLGRFSASAEDAFFLPLPEALLLLVFVASPAEQCTLQGIENWDCWTLGSVVIFCFHYFSQAGDEIYLTFGER